MEQNLLLDDLQPEITYASTAKRFAHLFIDMAGFYGFAVIIFILIANIEPSLIYTTEGEPIEGIGVNVLAWVIYFFYYFLFELSTGGRSLGKWITGTKVVMADGSKPDAVTLLKRNAIRFIPFEGFSAFGNPCSPWHDSWSGTCVIDIRKSQLNAY
jgi:uncharacterized RDD family membrane protein YckC